MRTKNSVINTIVTLMGQILVLLIAFPARMVFVNTLGVEYLGINGLFTNILSVLSIAELGIGSAIIFSLYKPVADNNERLIVGIMNLYAKTYRVIGGIVFGLGLMLIPFLKYIVGQDNSIPNMTYVYLLFLINSSSSYLLAYKRSIIIANQKSYIINGIHSIVLIVMNIFQAMVLIYTKDYILYLWIQLISSLSENIIVTIIANIKYKFLIDKTNKHIKIDVKTKNEIVKNIKALVIHKIGSITVLGTDNIIISTFVGVVWVGLYSNYCLIVNAINAILSQIFNSLTASVGNLNVTVDNEKKYSIYSNILFLNFWIVSFSTVTLYNMLNPFIDIWLGTEYTMSHQVVFVIVMNFYITGIRHTTLTFKSAAGLFWQDRYKPLIESMLNILISIILATKLGISGVLIGTIISSLLTNVWVEPYILFKYCFNKPVREYFKRYTVYIIVMLTSMMLTGFMSNIISVNGIIKLVYNAIICVIVPNILYALIFIRTDEFKYFFNIIRNVLKKLRGR